MKLIRKNKYASDEFFCDITKELDWLCGYSDEQKYKNYLLDMSDIRSNIYAIRVPGRTTGTVRLDKNNVIVECFISSYLTGVGRIYPEVTNEILKKFIGVVVER